MTVDPVSDFSGYMNDLAEAEAAAQRTREILEQHEIWRHTTWTGWVVRNCQALVKQLEPFIDQMVEPFRDSNSVAGAFIFNFIRLVAILVVMLSVSIIAKVIQSMIGQEIVVEEEIVILHEHASEEEAAKARAKNMRSKKEKRH